MPQAGRQAGRIQHGPATRLLQQSRNVARPSDPLFNALLLNHHSLLEQAVIHQPEEEPHGSACKYAADCASVQLERCGMQESGAQLQAASC